METFSNKDELEKQNLDNKIIFKMGFYGKYHIYDIDYFNKDTIKQFCKKIINSNIDYNEVLMNNTSRKIYFDIDYMYDTNDEMIKSRDIFIKNFETDLKKYILYIDKNIDIKKIEII